MELAQQQQAGNKCRNTNTHGPRPTFFSASRKAALASAWVLKEPSEPSQVKVRNSAADGSACAGRPATGVTGV